MYREVIIFLVFSLFLNFSMAQTKSERKKLKNEKADELYEATKNLIESGNFVFVANWAYPLGGNRINLITNPNFLKITDGSSDIQLPYFGVIQRATTYTGRGGIYFKGKPDKYKVDFNDKKKKINIQFTTKEKTEQSNFTMSIGKSGRGSVIVTNSNKQSITYQGILKHLEAVEK